MDKSLPTGDKRKQAVLQLKKGEERQKVDNIFTKKFPDMKDFPYAQKISIFEKQSFIGEDDLFNGKNHSATLKCLSQKGTLFKMHKE